MPRWSPAFRFARRLTQLCSVVLPLLFQGCARTIAPALEQAGATVRLPVRVTNDSPEIVHLWFISETGHKVRVGTVTPYTTAVLSTVLSTTLTGRFYARRLSNDVVTRLNGDNTIDAAMGRDRTVIIRLGPEAPFDFVQLR